VTSPSPLIERTPRIDGLTGLRWWAAFGVFFFHMAIFAPLPGPIAAFFGQGYLGVTFFFVLSGFVLTWSASSRISQSTFYWRRFARVYPAHFVALLFAIPVFYSFGAGPEPVWMKPFDPGVLSLSFLLLQGWSLVPAILFSGNPAAWTLTCEAFFYAVHPFLSKVLGPRSRRGALVFAVFAVAVAFGYRALAVAFPGSIVIEVPTPVVRLTEFVLGMALAWAIRRGWRPRIGVVAGIVSLFGVISAIAIVPTVLPDSVLSTFVSDFGNEFVIVACGVLIVGVAMASLAGKRLLLASAVQVRLGEWSYAFYLVHATFIYVGLRIFGLQEPSWRNLMWYPILLVATLAGAAVLHNCVEKPLESRLRRWKDRRAAAPSS
jgi:peptidoglycan/LPS O-acetylase OafA/YrhL